MVNNSIRKLKAVSVALHFNDTGNIEEASILCYCDSSFCNLKGESSQGGQIIVLQGSNCKVSPVTWQSNKIKRIVKSALAAEALALDESADACFYIRTLLCEISGKNEENIFQVIINTDNKNLHGAVHSTGTLEDKQLKLDICSLHQKLVRKEIEQINWIRKDLQLADCLTKNEAPTKYLIKVLHGELTL